LKDKVALVTAASRGLGKAAALALALEGTNVSICSRSEQIHHAAEEIRRSVPGRVWAAQTDLTRSEQVQELVNNTLEAFGRIDILILNAGGPTPGNFTDLSAEDWREALDLTLMSAVHLCYAVVPHMIAQGSGSIVASQSFTVKQPLDNLILSNAIRLAVIGMMKSLANELGPKGIRVNSINPGWTWSERVDQLLEDRAQRNHTSAQDEARVIGRSIPLGRIATLEEYGRTIAWLASPAASYIHGHALQFDGGATQSPL
jgi:3-oxoacyl-[acyl-carrier protein] reductase